MLLQFEHVSVHVFLDAELEGPRSHVVKTVGTWTWMCMDVDVHPRLHGPRGRDPTQALNSFANHECSEKTFDAKFPNNPISLYIVQV